MAKMGFEQNNNKVVKIPLVANNFTNAICYGKTGSGKTSGYILPNVENRMKLGHGLLVYDFKGNMHTQIKAIASKQNKLEDIIEIGKPWGEKINIIKNLSDKQLKIIFSNIHGGSQDPYWKNAASNLFIAIYKIHLNLEQVAILEKKLFELPDYFIDSTIFGYETKIVSLLSIFNEIKSVNSIVNFFSAIDKDVETINNNITQLLDHEPSRKTILKMANHLKKIKIALLEIESYRKIDQNDREKTGGIYGVMDVLNSTISNAATYEFLNEDQFDIVTHLRNGKTIIIDLSSIDESLLGLLNLSIYQSLQKNNDIANSSPVTIFIDEAQKVLHPNYLPDVDICRESKFEYIFATQDKLLLDSSIGQREADKLLSNIVEQYSFATNKNRLEKFEYENLVDVTTKFSEGLFFKSEELFDVEYTYQTLLNILSMVDVNELPTGVNEFILVNSSSLYDKGEVYIKTKKDKLHIMEIINYDESLLDDFFKKDKLQKREYRENLNLATKEMKIKDYLCDDKKDSKDKTISDKERIGNLEILYYKSQREIKSLENKCSSAATAALTCIQKYKSMEATLERIKK